MNFSFLPIRTIFAASALATALLFAGAAPLGAEDDCQKRTIKADHKLHEAAAKHGWDSPEAEKYRHELSDARSSCWEHGHRWWSEEDNRWHTERDWNDHDHEHAPH
jgi:hypothetical protein